MLHFDLILARLSDEMPRRYLAAINFVASNGEVREHQAPYMPPGLANDLRDAIHYLTLESLRLPKVREVLIRLAAALGVESSTSRVE